jgi:hypothetical protein
MVHLDIAMELRPLLLVQKRVKGLLEQHVVDDDDAEEEDTHMQQERAAKPQRGICCWQKVEYRGDTFYGNI